MPLMVCIMDFIGWPRTSIFYPRILVVLALFPPLSKGYHFMPNRSYGLSLEMKPEKFCYVTAFL